MLIVNLSRHSVRVHVDIIKTFLQHFLGFPCIVHKLTPWDEHKKAVKQGTWVPSCPHFKVRLHWTATGLHRSHGWRFLARRCLALQETKISPPKRESRKFSCWKVSELVGDMFVSWRITCMNMNLYETEGGDRYVYSVDLVKSSQWIGFWSDRQPRADVGGDTGPRRAWHSRRRGRQCWEVSKEMWNDPSLIHTHLTDIPCSECTEIYA